MSRHLAMRPDLYRGGARASPGVLIEGALGDPGVQRARGWADCGDLGIETPSAPDPELDRKVRVVMREHADSEQGGELLSTRTGDG